MVILAEAQKILGMAMKLVEIAKTGKDLLTNVSDKLESELIWQEMSRIAAKNAAKPEIQGYSEHDE